ncbi:hypothetical protein LX64_02931 [Chitinophaga skermanii]|uniref:Uncharacterized protein n=1 Tax=Chitinophaga skermanii TaxID=331697 RepID=A0A327QK36_9BACT|nr:hypothetical protein [Chitinophaga skermanii]RAJ04054.1 hypothetical protein LX64_02931 [Chitinophaga skermanii]
MPAIERKAEGPEVARLINMIGVWPSLALLVIPFIGKMVGETYYYLLAALTGLPWCLLWVTWYYEGSVKLSFNREPANIIRVILCASFVLFTTGMVIFNGFMFDGMLYISAALAILLTLLSLWVGHLFLLPQRRLLIQSILFFTCYFLYATGAIPILRCIFF